MKLTSSLFRYLNELINAYGLVYCFCTDMKVQLLPRDAFFLDCVHALIVCVLCSQGSQAQLLPPQQSRLPGAVEESSKSEKSLVHIGSASDITAHLAGPCLPPTVCCLIFY